MSYIVISPLETIAQASQAHGISHMVSLMSPGHDVERPSTINESKHLYLAMNDINFQTDGLIPPGESHLRQLIDFVRQWDRSNPMLIHCWFGISRSPAAALISSLALNPNQDDRELAQKLRTAAPSATPNRKIIEIGDQLLARNGRLSSAVNEIGRGREASSGTPFVLDL